MLSFNTSKYHKKDGEIIQNIKFVAKKDKNVKCDDNEV